MLKDLVCHTKEAVVSPENQGDHGTIRCAFLNTHCAHHWENVLKEAGQEGGWLIVKRDDCASPGERCQARPGVVAIGMKKKG